MNEIYQLLDQLEPVEQDQQQMRPLTALFHYPLALALFLALVYLLWLNSSSALGRLFVADKQIKGNFNG